MEQGKLSFGYVFISDFGYSREEQFSYIKKQNILESDIYVDSYKDSESKRPFFHKMLSRLDENTVLYIPSVECLGRNYKEMQDNWNLITKEKNANIVVLDMPFLDTREANNPMGNKLGDMVFDMLEYFKNKERAYRHEVQKKGIDKARAEGRITGRPKVPLPDNFVEIYNAWRAGNYSGEEAAKLAGMSRSTFLRRVKKCIDEGIMEEKERQRA